MADVQSLALTKWNCKYHVVFLFFENFIQEF